MSDIFSLNLRPNFRLVFAKQINFKIFWAWAVWDWFLAEGGGYILLGNGLVSRIPRAPFHPISCISFPQETLHSIFCIANTAASSLSGLWLMWGGEKSRRRGDLTTIEVGVVNIVEEVESWGRLYSIVEIDNVDAVVEVEVWGGGIRPFCLNPCPMGRNCLAWLQSFTGLLDNLNIKYRTFMPMTWG